MDIYIRMLPAITVNAEIMQNALSTGYLNATDMADYLVGKGMPFRESPRVCRPAVSYGLDHKKELHEFTLDELRRFSDLIEEDIFPALTIFSDD